MKDEAGIQKIRAREDDRQPGGTDDRSTYLLSQPGKEKSAEQ